MTTQDKTQNLIWGPLQMQGGLTHSKAGKGAGRGAGRGRRAGSRQGNMQGAGWEEKTKKID